MASVLDSIRNFSNDKLFLPKAVLLFFPVLLLYLLGEEVYNFPYLIWCIIYYFLGYLIVTCHGAIKNNDLYLPNPVTSIVDVIFRGFVGILCVIPISVGAFFLILWFENTNTIAQIKYVAIIFTILIWISIVLVQLTLYSKDYSPLNAFNFKIIMDVGGEFIIQLLKFFIQVAVFIGLPAYLVYLAGNSAIIDNSEAFVIFKNALYAFTTLIIYLVSIEYFVQLYQELVISEEDTDYLHL